MADLVTEIQSRMSAKRLAQLTNPDNAAGAGVNATNLANAANDVGGDFLAFAGYAFDPTKKEHVAAGVRGMVLYLRSYQGQDVEEALDRWHGALGQLQAQNAWVPPTSSSGLTPTTDAENKGSPARPDFDETKFRPYGYRDRQGMNSGGAGAPFDNS